MSSRSFQHDVYNYRGRLYYGRNDWPVYYTDGSARVMQNNGGNHARAGSGVYAGRELTSSFRCPGRVRFCIDLTVNDTVVQQTSGHAELQAILEAMNMANDEDEDEEGIYIMSDSTYAINACTLHHEKDPIRTWYNQNGTKMINQEVIKDIYDMYGELEVYFVRGSSQELKCSLKVRFKKVDAHAGDYGNEQADELARLGQRLRLQN